MIGSCCTESVATKFNPRSSGSEEVAGDVELSVRAENQAGGVHQVKVRVSPADSNKSINQGRIAANNPTEDILNLGVGKEVGQLVCIEAELPETVEEIGSITGERAAGNHELVAVDGDDRSGSVRCGGDGLSFSGFWNEATAKSDRGGQECCGNGLARYESGSPTQTLRQDRPKRVAIGTHKRYSFLIAKATRPPDLTGVSHIDSRESIRKGKEKWLVVVSVSLLLYRVLSFPTA